MLTFIQYLLEDEIPYNHKTNHGFWNDPTRDYVDVYHGTHERNIKSIEQNGLNRPDPKTGMISVTMDPNTAHGYAAMSGSGGEANFRRAGAKPVNTPHEERAVLKFRIPRTWLNDNMDTNLRGNIGDALDRMQSKERYDEWRKNNPVSDHGYYSTTELRLDKPIPKEFYMGHSYRYPRKQN